MQATNNTVSNIHTIVNSTESPNLQALDALRTLQSDATAHASDATLQADLNALEAIINNNPGKVTLSSGASLQDYTTLIQAAITLSEKNSGSKTNNDIAIADTANTFYMDIYNSL